MEWITNIGNWFQENFTSFTMWMQTFDLTTAIALVVLVVKQFLSTRTNTKTMNLLDTSLTENKAVKQSVDKMTEAYNELKAEYNNVQAKLNDIVDSSDKTLSKINAILDMYTVVYQTIKNEDSRIAVHNIIANARYNETQTREALVKRIETLQTEVQTLVDNATAKVNDVVEQSKQILASEPQKDVTPVVVPRG